MRSRERYVQDKPRCKLQFSLCDRMYGLGCRFWLATALCFAFGVGSRVLADDVERWCFRFTWLGPSWDNMTSLGNHTCNEMDLKQPCTGPLVITHDGSPPDTKLMWNTYEQSTIACKLSRNQVCLKWSTYYDGALENVTHMCGKMTDDDSGPITTGCESQDNGAYTNEVCACTDFLGIPCNSVPSLTPSVLLAVLFVGTALVAT